MYLCFFELQFLSAKGTKVVHIPTMRSFSLHPDAVVDNKDGDGKSFFVFSHFVVELVVTTDEAAVVLEEEDDEEEEVRLREAIICSIAGDMTPSAM
jgi:hypothetical protein